MSPRAAAAAVARSAGATIHAPTRTRPGTRRPAPARRRSGTVPRGNVRALPRPDFVSVLDRLLRGPAYIALVGILLAGIVFFNVDVLELNHGIAKTDSRASQLKRDNAALTLQLAKLGSSERIQRVALQRGLVLPQPGDVRYLRTGRQDAARALRVMTAPGSSSAAAVVPATVVSQQSRPTPVSATPVQPVSTTPATTTTTTTPVTTTQPTAQPTAQPTGTAPAASTPPPTTTQGGAAAPATTTP